LEAGRDPAVAVDYAEGGPAWQPARPSPRSELQFENRRPTPGTC